MKKYLHLLKKAGVLDNRLILKIERKFDGDFEYAWKRSSREEWRWLRDKADVVWLKILEGRRKLSEDEEMEKLIKMGIRIVWKEDSEYPENLRNLVNAPVCLYVKGGKLVKRTRRLAIVGTRKPTEYGRKITMQLCDFLSSLQVEIVSGLALGIDGLAHYASLKNGMRNLAVLANGLDKVRPIANISLGEKIVKDGGCLISEYPPGWNALGYCFLERNRIIAGLSDEIIVVEAGERSGSLMTARIGFENGRRVWAVPGRLDSEMSRGTNELNSKLIAEILFDFEGCLGAKGNNDLNVYNGEVPENMNLLELIKSGYKSIDELVNKSGLGEREISVKITEMELLGLIRVNENGEII